MPAVPPPEPRAGDWEPAEIDRESEDQQWTQHEARHGKPKEAHQGKPLIDQAPTANGSENTRGERQGKGDGKRCESERERVRIAGDDEVRDAVVEADGRTEISVSDAAPVVDVLLPKRLIESVLMAKGADVSGGCALAEYLENRIAGDEMNEQEDQRQPQAIRPAT